jgi:hypothetical protein
MRWGAMPRVVPSQVVEAIDRVFLKLRNQVDSVDCVVTLDRTYRNELAAILELCDQIPAELLALDSESYTRYQLAITAIRITLPEMNIRNIGISTIRGYGYLNPVTIIRNTLANCPDDGIATSTSDLAFIADEALRRDLRVDITSANQALRSGEWKATTILAGATAEALLLYVLQSIKEKDPQTFSSAVSSAISKGVRNPGNDLDQWSLHSLIEVAVIFELIGEKTATQARLAKDFRNLVHPGRAVRTGQTCSRGTALSALAALELIESDLLAHHRT